MRFAIMRNMARAGWVGLLFRMGRTVRCVYRMGFVARAGEIGLLALLAQKPLFAGEAAQALGLDARQAAILEAFLDTGVAVGELRRARGRYALKGRLSRSLAKPGNDPWLALAGEVARLHVPCLLGAPGDQEDRRHIASLTTELSSVIARSSRSLEPLMRAVVREVVPERGPCNLLEMGCGSGVYVQAALERNPELTATALEREEDVFRDAWTRIERSGHGGRCRMRNADVRDLEFDREFGREFDLITLYNNIYYFPEAERAELLARLGSWLKPGGRLVLTTTCQGGGPFSRLMLLWSRLCEGAGGLPDQDGFVACLRRAGFGRVEARSLMPGESFILFEAGEFAG